MIFNTLKSYKSKINISLFKRVTSFSQNLNWPIKLNFKDTLLKYSKYSYSIIYKMEDNFETKLKNIGK